MEQRVKIDRHIVHLRIEAPKINDPLGRGIRAGIDQLLPILERSRTQRKAVVVIESETGPPA